MTKSKKEAKKSPPQKRSVKVKDLSAKKNPKGGSEMTPVRNLRG